MHSPVPQLLHHVELQKERARRGGTPVLEILPKHRRQWEIRLNKRVAPPRVGLCLNRQSLCIRFPMAGF